MTLTDNGATVTDANSGLIWQRCAAGQICTGEEANLCIDDNPGYHP